jgi:hypothetical protein
MFFSYTDEPDNFIPLTVDRVKEVMEMNKNGVKPEDLSIKIAAPKVVEKKPDYENVVGQDSLTRFDQKKKSKFKNKKKGDSAQKNAGTNKPQGQKQNNAGPKPTAAQGQKQNTQGPKPNAPKQNAPAPKPNNQGNRQHPNQPQEGKPQSQPNKQQGHQQRNRPKPNNRPRPANNNSNNPNPAQ